MKKELGGNILKLAFFSLCIYGIVRLSIWSYFQTQAFFEPFDGESGNTIISNAMALLFQYGQNVSLFLASMEQGRQLAYRNKIANIRGNVTHINILEEEIKKSENLSMIFYVLFGIFALVDAGTNVGQFLETTFLSAKETFASTTTGFYIFLGVGLIVSVAVVFVEELFMKTANAVLHAFNDVLESIGLRRIPSLDLFVDPDKIIATRLEERGEKKSQGSSFSKPQAPSFSKPKPIQQGQNLQRNGTTQTRPVSKQISNQKRLHETYPINGGGMAEFQNMFAETEDEDSSERSAQYKRSEPVYHPIGMNAQGDVKSRFDA